jgi:hypothetical protein
MIGKPQTAAMNIFLNSILSAPGNHLEEKTAAVLAQRGWDKELNKVADRDFRSVIIEAIEHLAEEVQFRKIAEDLAVNRTIQRSR